MNFPNTKIFNHSLSQSKQINYDEILQPEMPTTDENKCHNEPNEFDFDPYSDLFEEKVSVELDIEGTKILFPNEPYAPQKVYMSKSLKNLSKSYLSIIF